MSDAYKIVQLIINGSFKETGLLKDLLESSLPGLEAYTRDQSWKLPADYRLAFRELGMAIGLNAVERIEKLLGERPELFAKNHPVYSLMKNFTRYAGLSGTIEKFWLGSQNRKAQTWTEHLDINSVMLATSLAPDGYLEL